MISARDAWQCLAAATLLLVAAHGMRWVFARARQPRVIGEIMGGLLLGPTLLTHFFPSAMARALSPSGPVMTMRSTLSQVGLVLLMYLSGAHLRSFVQRDERKLVSMLALAGIILPFLTGLGAVRFIDEATLIGPANSSLALLLVFATAIAIASIPVISRIMMDLGIMETSFARIVIATAVIDDIVLYIVLAVALGLVPSQGGAEQGLPSLLGLDPASLWAPAYHVAATIALIMIMLLAGPLVFRRVFGLRSRALAWDSGAVAQSLVLIAVTLLCRFLAVNPMFGALTAGIAAGGAASQAGAGSSRTITWLAQAVFIPIYFALIGLKLDLIHHFAVAFFVAFLAFACVVKALSIYAGARLAGESRPAALNFAAALNARGGPGIVLASVAFEAKIVNENFFAILVLLAVVTSLLAGSWLGHAVRRGVPLR